MRNLPEGAELLGIAAGIEMYLVDGKLLMRRERYCSKCGEIFFAIRRGKRGPYTNVCDDCKPAPQKRGPKRTGAEYQTSAGYVIVAPIDDVDRAHPTTWHDGRIKRSHLVWNRANPADPVMPEDHVHHKNRNKADDRIENLQKLTPHEHATEHSDEMEGRLHIEVARVCLECGTDFQGSYASKFCSDACRRERTNRANREKRAAATARTGHPCKNCGAEIFGRAVYCNNAKCRTASNTAKQRRWAAKPEVKLHLRDYRASRKASE